MKPSLRLPCEGLRSGTLVLAEETGRYAVKVHRLEVGDRVLLFDPAQGLQAYGRIAKDRLPHIEVEIEGQPGPGPRENLPITLIQGVGKGDKPEQAVRDATVFGAQRVVFVHTARGVAKSSGDGKLDRLLRVAEQTARQCGRGDLPRIEAPTPLADFLATPANLEGAVRLVCCWTEDAVPLLDGVSREQVRRGVAILIGPEGGLSDEEIALARDSGYLPISLGPYVLRTEVACGAVLSALRARDLTR